MSPSTFVTLYNVSFRLIPTDLNKVNNQFSREVVFSVPEHEVVAAPDGDTHGSDGGVVPDAGGAEVGVGGGIWRSGGIVKVVEGIVGVVGGIVGGSGAAGVVVGSIAGGGIHQGLHDRCWDLCNVLWSDSWFR